MELPLTTMVLKGLKGYSSGGGRYFRLGELNEEGVCNHTKSRGSGSIFP